MKGAGPRDPAIRKCPAVQPPVEESTLRNIHFESESETGVSHSKRVAKQGSNLKKSCFVLFQKGFRRRYFLRGLKGQRGVNLDEEISDDKGPK